MATYGLVASILKSTVVDSWIFLAHILKCSLLGSAEWFGFKQMESREGPLQFKELGRTTFELFSACFRELRVPY